MKDNIREMINLSDRAFVNPNVYVSPDEQFTFTYIPKNASTWAHNFFQRMSWHNRPRDSYPTAKPLAILRDPNERWVNGIAQFLLWRFDDVDGQELEDLLNNQMFWELIFTHFQFDPHSIKQSAFLTRDMLKRGTFFKFEQGVSNLVSYLKEQGYQINEDVALRVYNPGDSDLRKQVYVDRVSELLATNTDFKERLDYTNEQEYRFMSNLNFYEGKNSG